MGKVQNIFLPPRNRRRFFGKWDEVSYLCDKLEFYQHIKRVRHKSKGFFSRLRFVLSSMNYEGGAIVGERALALINEFEGNWARAISHRKNEIKLILQLYCSFTINQPLSVKTFALNGNTKKTVLSRFFHIRKTYDAFATTTHVSELDTLLELLAKSKHC